MDTIIYQQDTLLVSKKTEISNLNQKVKYSDSCATENKTRAEFYKSEYDVQVRNKWIAIILGSVTTLCSLIFF